MSETAPVTPTTPAVATPPAPAAAPATTTPASGQLPDDHPLVKAFNANKAELADAKKKLTDIDEANKTDAQKQADKLAALEKENSDLKVATLRATVAAAKGVPPEFLTGATEAELNAAADKLLAFKGTPGSALPGNQRPAGPVSQVQEHEETKEDRLKRLEALKR